MRYHGAVIRPPSEADSLILQVTYGCSHNTCDFCGTYPEKPFRARLAGGRRWRRTSRAARVWYKKDCRRVFLADGDAVILAQRRLLEVLSLLREELP